MARNAFDISGQAVAATTFVFAGVEYERGQPFPHKALGLHVTAVRGLWLADKINFVDAPAAPPPPRPAPPQHHKRR